MSPSSAGPIVLTASEADRGSRLDRFLAATVPDLSRSRAGALARDGLVSGPGGTIVEPSYRVKPGDRFEVEMPPPADAVPRGEAIALDVLYEDDDLIVIDKPAGLVVHPGAGNPDGTLVNALIAHCGASLSGIGGVKRPGIVHRLDKGTSGVMVAAKNDFAHQALSSQFADHGRTGPLRRAYLALVWGAPERGRGVIDRPLARLRGERIKQGVVREGQGRSARTHYEVVETFPSGSPHPIASLVRCTLETGRTHQIRVHMEHLGFPVMGDDTYARGYRTKAAKLTPKAREALERLGRQALHAAELCFAHPRDGRLMEFTAPIPTEMAALAVELSQV